MSKKNGRVVKRPETEDGVVGTVEWARALTARVSARVVNRPPVEPVIVPKKMMENTEESDYIIVKVALKTTADPNDSSIQRDWHDLLKEWCEINHCNVERIEWTRLRKRHEKRDPDLGRKHDEVYWDVVEEKK